MGARASRSSERRLTAAARRAQIVDVAHRLVLEDPRLPVSPEAVAAAAGVSKPLVFHYFPTVPDLQVAVFELVADDLIARLDTGTDVPPDQRLRLGIEAFIDYATQHATLYLLLMRGGGADVRMLEAMDSARNRVARLIGRGMGIQDPPAPLMLVLRGYVAFIEETVLEWLANRPFPRETLVDLLADLTTQATPAAARVLRDTGSTA